MIVRDLAKAIRKAIGPNLNALFKIRVERRKQPDRDWHGRFGNKQLWLKTIYTSRIPVTPNISSKIAMEKIAPLPRPRTRHGLFIKEALIVRKIRSLIAFFK